MNTLASLEKSSKPAQKTHAFATSCPNTPSGDTGPPKFPTERRGENPPPKGPGSRYPYPLLPFVEKALVAPPPPPPIITLTNPPIVSTEILETAKTTITGSTNVSENGPQMR